jgi:acylphosphatase
MARPKKRSKVHQRNRVTARGKARKATKSTRGKASKRAMEQKQAISATVTGNDQQVGFRAMVMKQAIKYNLAGSAKNERTEIVQDSERKYLASFINIADNCGPDVDKRIALRHLKSRRLHLLLSAAACCRRIRQRRASTRLAGSRSTFAQSR